MYGSIGSISGVIHVVARRPYIAAALVAAVLVVNAPTAPPPAPPAPPAPVTVEAPMPVFVPPSAACRPADPEPSLAGVCMFGTAQPVTMSKSARVNNECKALLDDAVLALKKNPDATLLVIGHTAPGEADVLALTRANNVKAYLTSRAPGVDGSRISTVKGGKNGRSTELWLVPAGAKFAVPIN